MPKAYLRWVYLFSLALLWGSSFILIKKGLVGLSPIQLAAFRVLVTGLFLVAIGFKKLSGIAKVQWFWMGVSGFIGTLLPSMLFAYAETEIDSAVASILNSIVPLLALLIGLLFFSVVFKLRQFVGVIIGLLGTVVLILAGASLHEEQNYWYAFFPVGASLMYAFNANVIKYKLEGLSALGIATGSFVVLMPFSVGLLLVTGFFDVEFLAIERVQISMGYVLLLALLGTALAKILFNKLIQLSNPVFSTSVTYFIPLVALGWGLLDGEVFSLYQLAGAFIILVGVYLANTSRKKHRKKSTA